MCELVLTNTCGESTYELVSIHTCVQMSANRPLVN